MLHSYIYIYLSNNIISYIYIVHPYIDIWSIVTIDYIDVFIFVYLDALDVEKNLRCFH